MGCCGKKPGSLLNQLKEVVNQIDDGGCCPPPKCCAPCCPAPYAYAECFMNFPPPICPPTRAEPVKPLQLPCPKPCPEAPRDPEQDFKTRYSNFYNNYNIDFHNPPQTCCYPSTDCNKKEKPNDCDAGCPTGFKPCKMKLTPPPFCHPYGVWCAQIQPCPPKPKKRVSNFYEPGECKRPCCKHWKPKEPCKYDDPCKAHCYDHPVGIKPSGRYP